MVLGSNVESTARLPFLVLRKNNHTTLLFICQYPSQNFKELQPKYTDAQMHS